MIRACVFDVDGTLIDSVDAHASAWVETFREFGHSVSFDEMRSQIGKGSDQLMPVFLPQQEIEHAGKAIEAFRAGLLKRCYLSEVRAFPKVRDLFKRLQSDGIKVVLASSAKGEELQAYKEKAGIDDLVHDETSSDDADRSKPFGDIFEAALTKLVDISRENVIVIGDTPYDAEAARKVGLRTIGVRCGGFPDDALRQAGCIRIYDNPADVLAHYDEFVQADMM